VLRVLAGLTSTAIRKALGSISRSSSSRFSVNSVFGRLMPVRLPPSRARLATRPCLTGSSDALNTMGIVVVAPLAASSVAKRPTVAITATCRRNQLRRKFGESFHLLGPAVVDRYVLALDIAGFFEALVEGRAAAPQLSQVI